MYLVKKKFKIKIFLLKIIVKIGFLIKCKIKVNFDYKNIFLFLYSLKGHLILGFTLKLYFKIINYFSKNLNIYLKTNKSIFYKSLFKILSA